MKQHKIKHGHYTGDRPSPEYYSWRSIKSRCLDPKHHSYHNYGGNGIPIFDGWINNFEAFLKEVGLRPSPYHTLDRIENSKGYVPGNVRWVTQSVQNRNRSDNNWITANNITLCIEDWAKKLGCSPAAIRCRIKRGWSKEEAVTKPVNPKFQGSNNLTKNENSRRIWNLHLTIDINGNIKTYLDGEELEIVSINLNKQVLVLKNQISLDLSKQILSSVKNVKFILKK